MTDDSYLVPANLRPGYGVIAEISMRGLTPVLTDKATPVINEGYAVLADRLPVLPLTSMFFCEPQYLRDLEQAFAVVKEKAARINREADRIGSPRMEMEIFCLQWDETLMPLRMRVARMIVEKLTTLRKVMSEFDLDAREHVVVRSQHMGRLVLGKQGELVEAAVDHMNEIMDRESNTLNFAVLNAAIEAFTRPGS